jgi:hypothetical protein
MTKTKRTTNALLLTVVAGAACFLSSSTPVHSAPPEPADPYLGLQPGLGTLPMLGQGRTRSISAENPTAFLVGKDGKIIWIGHPMQLQESIIEAAFHGR